MEKFHQHPFATSVLTCMAMVLLGTVLAGDGLEAWYAGLEKPAFLVPLWGFCLVGVLYYLLFGVVIYRIAACRRAPNPLPPACARGRRHAAQ